MQINRLFEIIYIIMEKKTVTARELAERFEVSPRTIYRDVEILSAAGIPIYMSKGKGGGISLLDDFILNKAVLTEEEKTDIVSAMKAVEAIHCTRSNTVLKKLSSMLGDKESDWFEIDFSSWYSPTDESDKFHQIKAAILENRRVRFTYVSNKGEETMRTVEPMKLCFKGTSQYLYAYCIARDDYRFFKLSRIKELEVTEENFERAAVGPIFTKKNAPSIELITLKLKITGNMAFRVFDEFDTYTKDEEGNFIVEAKVPLGQDMIPYLISYGRACEVLEPQTIRDAVIEEIKKISELYS